MDQPPIQEQPVEQKMFAMFQKMTNDPAMFMKLMGAISAEENTKKQSQSREREFQIEQHKYRNHKVSPRKSPTAAGFP